MGGWGGITSSPRAAWGGCETQFTLVRGAVTHIHLSARERCTPKTRKPTNPQTRKPVNPRTREPVNP